MPEQKTDHELSIIHSEQLKTVCKMIGETNRTLTDFIVKIDKRCDIRRIETQRIQDTSMKTGTFWKILTVLVIILMSMLGVMNYNRQVSLTNEIKIEYLTALTEKNGKLLEELLKGLISDRHDANLYEKRRGQTE